MKNELEVERSQSKPSIYEHSKISTVNLEDFYQSITDLYGKESITIQTIADDKDNNEHLLSFLFDHLSGNIISSLVELNKDSACVSVMFNLTNSNKRKKIDVIKFRAVFVDLEGSPLQPFLALALKPNLIVESSPKRYYVYWIVGDCPIGRYNLLEQQLKSISTGNQVW